MLEQDDDSGLSEFQWRATYSPERHPAIGVPYRKLNVHGDRNNIQEILDSSLQPTGKILRIDELYSEVAVMPFVAHEFKNYLNDVLSDRYHIATLRPKYIIGEDVDKKPWLYTIVDKLEGATEIEHVLRDKDVEGLEAYDKLIATLATIMQDAYQEDGKIYPEIMSPHQYALVDGDGRKVPILFDIEPDEPVDLTAQRGNNSLDEDRAVYLKDAISYLARDTVRIARAMGRSPNCFENVMGMLKMTIDLGLLERDFIQPYINGLEGGDTSFIISSDGKQLPNIEDIDLWDGKL